MTRPRLNHFALSGLLFLGTLVMQGGIFAQVRIEADQTDMTLTAPARAEIIEGVVKRLKHDYVFPETATKMAQSLENRLVKKEYDQVTSAKEFARLLTTHLQEISHDKHLHVVYLAVPPPQFGPKQPTPDMKEKMRQSASGAISDSRRSKGWRGISVTSTCAASCRRSWLGRPRRQR